MTEVTGDKVEQVLDSLETVLDGLEEEHGKNSSFLPSLKQLIGDGDVPSLVASAESSVDNIRGILDIDAEYSSDEVKLSGSAKLSLQELVNTLTSVENELDHEGQIEAVKSHRVVLEELLDAAEGQEGPDKNPATRAMQEMKESIENDPDLKTDFNTSSSSSEEKDIPVGDGGQTQSENDEFVDVDDELSQIKDSLDIDDDTN